MGLLEDIITALERIPIWKRLTGLPAELDALKARVAELEAKLSQSPGELCPKCRQHALIMESSEPDPHFADVGTMLEHLRCTACGYTQQRQRQY
jgi:ssDNA-binding Zn-finger/Zn-ribbon topoisomerase 1